MDKGLSIVHSVKRGYFIKIVKSKLYRPGKTHRRPNAYPYRRRDGQSRSVKKERCEDTWIIMKLANNTLDISTTKRFNWQMPMLRQTRGFDYGFQQSRTRILGGVHLRGDDGAVQRSCYGRPPSSRHLLFRH